MTDQPRQDAKVSQRASASAQALQTYLSIRGLKDGEIFRAFARFQAEIEAATIERCAKDMAQLKAENERLSKHVTSGVLPGLLDDDEKDALLDFVKHLRNLKGQTS